MDSIKGTFLSNFYECPIEYKGLVYRNAEAAFQAQKCADISQRQRFVNLSGAHAKSLGKTVALVPDWNDIKLQCMREILDAKFTQHPRLYSILLSTGDEEIIEGNWWGDTYWGMCNGKGSNHLGKILMWIRDREKGE